MENNNASKALTYFTERFFMQPMQMIQPSCYKTKSHLVT